MVNKQSGGEACLTLCAYNTGKLLTMY